MERDSSSFPKPAPRTWILQRNYGFVRFATLDEPILIREKTVHYSGRLRGEGSGLREDVAYVTKRRRDRNLSPRISPN
jgi:hypothetical protein